MPSAGTTAHEKSPLLSKRARPKSTDEILPSRSMNGIREAPWVRARKNSNGKRMPQTISHRGYKAAWPENTMKAFREAVAAGTHALETDIHLSKDDVVVLSHDPDLKRCFGRPEKVIDCDWDELSKIRTIREPPQPMPRLADVLSYLAEPAQEDIWLLLDIKLDNPADKVMCLISEAIKAAPTPSKPWNERIVLGIWAVKFLPLCRQYMPDLAVSNIGFNMAYTRQFLRVPNVSFNMLQRAIVGPGGKRWIHDMQASDRPLFSWTVNDTNLMKWCIQRNFDGVITDDPKRFREITDTWEANGRKEATARVTLRQWVYTFYLWILIYMFAGRLFKKFPETVQEMLDVDKKAEQLMRRASVDRTLDG